MSTTFTVTELELVIEALERAASRLESYARFNPRNARPHEDKATAMRKLRQRCCLYAAALEGSIKMHASPVIIPESRDSPFESTP